MRKLATIVIGIGVMMAGPAPAATSIHDEAPAVHNGHIFIRKPLAEVLGLLARDMGATLHVSPSVSGTVSGRYPPVPGPDLLDRLAEEFGLVWYRDGTALHVGSMSDLQPKLLPLRRVHPELMLAALRDLGLDNAKFTIEVSRQADLVRVVGPPAYVTRVQEVVATLAAGPNVTVLRGRTGP